MIYKDISKMNMELYLWPLVTWSEMNQQFHVHVELVLICLLTFMCVLILIHFIHLVRGIYLSKPF